MKIGSLHFDRPLALAPMEDVTDLPFRIVCKELGADLLYTEFASSEALIRDAKKTLKKIQVAEEERPVAVQIFGSSEESMEGAAAVAEAAGPDFIDINCGCWVKKVALRQAGAGLLRDLGQFEAVVRSVVRGTRLPVTVKTRLGWDPDSINILDAARMLEDLGVQALTVHCRTRDQGHAGDVDWEWLTRLKETVSIPILGNGDVATVQDVARMFDTGCDGVMIGRGAIHNPWIFKQAKHFLATGEELPPPSVDERIDLSLRHLGLSVEWKGEMRGITEFRKHYVGYFKGMPHATKARARFMELWEREAVAEELERCRALWQDRDLREAAAS
jgi:tRNA-dihydrouridine synthase B